MVDSRVWSRAPSFVALVILASTCGWAQSGTVEEVIPQGLRRMSEATFRVAFGIEPGDPYDPQKIRAAFRDLWDKSLFSNIVIEAEDGPNGGKVLIVKLTERPILSSVTYEDNKVLTRTQIEDRLAEQEIDLRIGHPIDMRTIFETEGAIRDYLGEKGFLTPQVWHEVREVTASSESVFFHIRSGGKTRIKKIEFKGNEVYNDRKLKQQLKLTQQSKWYWPWSSKSLYHPIKWDQDVGAVRDLYQAVGYLDVEIRPPVVEVINSKGNAQDPQAEESAVPQPTAKQLEQLAQAQGATDEAKRVLAETRAERPPAGLDAAELEKWQRQHQQRVVKANKQVDKQQKKLAKAERKTESSGGKNWVKLTVPVSEGVQYRTGEIGVEGNEVFDDLQLRALIPLREGMILSAALLKRGVDNITRLYEDRGYLYANVVRRINRHEGEPVGDVLVQVDEDQIYTVDSIEFSGNTATQDKVLRREFLLNESELFSRTRLNTSIAKVNQLGYYRVLEDPLVEPLTNKNAVRVTVAGEEQGRNEIQVGGGYSGVDGAFFTGFYSTRNFLGRGQVLAVSLQVGGRTNSYSVSFVEPWFLNRPWTAGFSLFRRDTDFGLNLTSSGRGGGIVLGRRLTAFSSIRLNYNYEEVTSTGVTVSGGDATNKISSLTPSYSFNKIMFPRRPTGGWSFESQVQMAGNFLGGDTNFLKPIVRYTGYQPLWKRRWMFAVHAELGLVRDFRGRSVDNTTTVNGIPRSLRYWLGGDTLGPRVFETRTITPLRFIKLNNQGVIVDVVRDPIGLPVSDYDRNGDGLLNTLDLVGLGGDRFYLIQNELVYPIAEQFDLAFFLDIGNSLFEDQDLFQDIRASAGIELRFHLPVFPVPLRLIYGVPVRSIDIDRTSNFTFSIGQSF